MPILDVGASASSTIGPDIALTSTGATARRRNNFLRRSSGHHLSRKISTGRRFASQPTITSPSAKNSDNAACGSRPHLFASVPVFLPKAYRDAIPAIVHAIDDYPVELLITLAMVMGGYALAQYLQISGPVAMAVAGLLIGNRGVALAMSDTNRDYVIKFWGLVDEILNAVLFLLIGLAAIPLVLVARAASTGAPLLLWRKSLPFQSTFPVLVWGGLRGGISIALALSLPSGPAKDLILTATYVVVLFSVLIQGSTISRVLPCADAPPAT